MATRGDDISISLSWLAKGGSETEGSSGGSRASGGQQLAAVSRRPDVLWLSSIMGAEPEESSCQQPKIQLVPPLLRDVESNKKCFDPMVVSIGPYHRGKPELQAMEELKKDLARQHVKESEMEIQELYDNVVKVAGDARKCYAEDSLQYVLGDTEFTQMLFLDGCFILQFISYYREKKMNMKSHNVAFVQRDLFLAENQIPFPVLEALIPPAKKDEWFSKICNFVDNKRARSPYHTVAVCPHSPPKNQRPPHLLGILHAQLIDPAALKQLSCKVSDWSSYRSAKELKAAGIRFKPSKTRRLTDVSFDSALFGRLKLPAMMIDDSTKSMLLNLVAYESCPDAPDDFGVTSYLCFMDVLIDHAEDVKELRSSGILFNYLGSDQEVADLFNEIARDLVPNPQAYAIVKGNIEKHYNNNAKIWIAEWLHAHFNSPWTFLAFIGALSALALSFVQTYFAAFSSDEHGGKNA